MACKMMNAPGRSKTHPDMVKEVIILVCGDRQCGKTTFIKDFIERLGNDGKGVVECPFAEMHTGKIYIHSILRKVKIFEILPGPENFKHQMDIIESKTKGIIFMYAIDDRSSFECLSEKWIPILGDDDTPLREDWPCILVGNKKDLRESPDSGESLAENNQRHVTRREGYSLSAKADGFYETSAIDGDVNIQLAFDIIVEKAILHWREDLSE